MDAICCCYVATDVRRVATAVALLFVLCYLTYDCFVCFVCAQDSMGGLVFVKSSLFFIVARKIKLKRNNYMKYLYTCSMFL